ncbi:hypothetical protein, partial [Streptomyces fradiae]|uniref:hypothetical protein n=1 Tax=Streptomyces fradiae TaxID=1906 RepID=UPI003819089D
MRVWDSSRSEKAVTKRGKNSLKQKARVIARREGINYSAALARLSGNQHCEPHHTECGNPLPDAMPLGRLVEAAPLFGRMSAKVSPFQSVVTGMSPARSMSAMASVLPGLSAKVSPFQSVVTGMSPARSMSAMASVLPGLS